MISWAYLIEIFMTYIKRLVEDELLAKMEASGAVLIKGPKSCMRKVCC